MLQETKISDWPLFTLRTLLPSYFDEHCVFLAAQNSRGGCLVAWRRCYSLANLWATRHTVSATLSDARTGECFTVTTVYGPQSEANKVLFVQELCQLTVPPQMPWIIAGDFNLIRWQIDRPNSILDWQLLDLFNDAIRCLNWYDVPLLDRKYTWSNKQQHPTFSRIDRIFLSPSFLSAFPQTRLNAGPMLTSDHVPLLLTCSQLGPTPSTNKMERFWLGYDDFHQITANVFSSLQTSSTEDPVQTFSRAVHSLHSRLRTWHVCKFANSNAYLLNCKTIVSCFDMIEETRPLTQLEFFIRIKVKEVAYELSTNLEIRWHQRSRCRWLAAGDRNTKYFHALASSMKNCNAIRKVVVQGEEIT